MVGVIRGFVGLRYSTILLGRVRFAGLLLVCDWILVCCWVFWWVVWILCTWLVSGYFGVLSWWVFVWEFLGGVLFCLCLLVLSWVFWCCLLFCTYWGCLLFVDLGFEFMVCLVVWVVLVWCLVFGFSSLFWTSAAWV